MFFESLPEHYQVIEIYQYLGHIHVSNYMLYEPLKCCWGPRDTLGHPLELKEPKQANKGIIFLILESQGDLVVSTI